MRTPKKCSWKPLSPETWSDFERLFGERGACGGCWYMTWRVTKKEFNANKGAGNRAAIRKLARIGHPLGVLLYSEGEAVGWCSVAPREDFIALGNSRVWAPVDEKPVWSVSCFFLAKKARRKGLSLALLNAAVEFASQNGAKIVEGYPQDLGDKELPAAFVWTGLEETFVRAGFNEAERRSKAKPIMRKETGKIRRKK